MRVMFCSGVIELRAIAVIADATIRVVSEMVPALKAFDDVEMFVFYRDDDDFARKLSSKIDAAGYPPDIKVFSGHVDGKIATLYYRIDNDGEALSEIDGDKMKLLVNVPIVVFNIMNAFHVYGMIPECNDTASFVKLVDDVIGNIIDPDGFFMVSDDIAKMKEIWNELADAISREKVDFIPVENDGDIKGMLGRGKSRVGEDGLLSIWPS